MRTPGIPVGRTLTTSAATPPPRGDRCARGKSAGCKGRMKPLKVTRPSQVSPGQPRIYEWASKSPRALSLRDQPRADRSPRSLCLSDLVPRPQALCLDSARGTASSQLCRSSSCTRLWISWATRPRNCSDSKGTVPGCASQAEATDRPLAKLQEPPDGFLGPSGTIHRGR